MKRKHLNSLRYLPPCALKATNEWPEVHLEAVMSPHAGFERAFVQMLRGWLEYADAVYDSGGIYGVGHDAVWGPKWAGIGIGLSCLLDGELGRLDAGTLSSVLDRALDKEGFDMEAL